MLLNPPNVRVEIIDNTPGSEVKILYEKAGPEAEETTLYIGNQKAIDKYKAERN